MTKGVSIWYTFFDCMYSQEKFSIKQWAEDDRPREKLVLKGKHTLTDAELLAIILGSGSVELSALDLAKRVLSSVNHDLYYLGKLTLTDLKSFKGIGEAKAVSILAALELGKRRKLAEKSESSKIISSNDVFDVMKQDIGDLKHEEFWILCLRQNNTLIAKHKISMGGVSRTIVDPKLVFNIALRDLASSIVICHNHPSGNLKPSEVDIQLTKNIHTNARLLEIVLLDHVIVTENGYYSFRDNNQL
ncbi:MAG TPA: DNA repair protein RadC [Chitinophagales bacterium]|nr:DNA repair protein RadC [Chitinophagales bacterium]